MKRAALCLLCLFVLIPAAAFADSITSISPSSFTQYDIEQFATLQGTGLEGSVSTEVVLSGAGGTFTMNGFPGEGSGGTILYVTIPDVLLSVPGQVSVTVHAIDAAGTRTIGPAYFNVIASGGGWQPPLLSIPEVVVAEAANSEGAFVTFSATGFSFNDPGPPTVVCTPSSGSQFPVGPTTVTCSATDSFATTTGAFEVNVTDTVMPVLHLPADFVTSNPVVTYTVTATDNVDNNPLVSCSPASGSTFSVGTTIVVCTATDAHANKSTGSFRVSVTGGANAPVITVPGDITSEASSAAGAAVSFVVTATDSASIICTPASGSTFPLGTTTVSCSATSPGGTSSDTFKVTVVDTTAPVLSLPGTINTGASSPAGAVVAYAASATDLVDGSVQAYCYPTSGSTFPIGTTVVQCSTVDSRQNFSYGAFTVVVSSDNTPPVLSLPANITVEATGAAGAVVTYTATAIDNVDGPVPVTCDHNSGSTFPIATTTVQCTATDAHNNTAHGSFLVTVRDTTPPVLTLPGSITAEATGPSGAAVTYTATATDLVDGSRPVNCDHASGSTFPLGSTIVQCTATDTHNNTATGSFTVLVQDTTPPTNVSIAASPSNLWPPNHQMVNVTVTVIATDLVDPAPMSHIVSVSSNQPDNGTGDGDTAGDSLITGPLTVQLRAERSQGNDRVYTITVATTDSSGNTSFKTVNVTVSQSNRGHAAGH